jgi:hypothetical protein
MQLAVFPGASRKLWIEDKVTVNTVKHFTEDMALKMLGNRK